MGLINQKRNIAVAQVNGYTVEKVLRAKKYLREIGMNRRTFPIEKLVEYYNDIKGTHETAVGCRPCQATKFYNGIKNYVTYGELTLINNGVATESDLDENKAVQGVETNDVEQQPTEEEKAPQIEKTPQGASLKKQAKKKFNKQKSEAIEE